VAELAGEKPGAVGVAGADGAVGVGSGLGVGVAGLVDGDGVWLGDVCAGLGDRLADRDGVAAREGRGDHDGMGAGGGGTAG
jgi:hypothetical protein